MAGNSNTMTVTATVQDVCFFDSTTSTLAFGSIDPSGTGPVTAATAITYTCNGVNTATVNSPAGGTMTSVSSGGSLAFTLSSVDDTAGTVNITGTVAEAAYKAALAGNDYTTTVTYTITP